MKKLLLFTLLVFASKIAAAQCHAYWTSDAKELDVRFTNLSTLTNAGYYWNFGDGTSSRYAEPLHTFPASGRYFITLFAKDSMGACVDYFEQWITVRKPEADGCEPAIDDSIYVYPWTGDDRIALFDASENCGRYHVTTTVGGMGSIGGRGHVRFLAHGAYLYSDSIPGQGWVNFEKDAYKSVLYKYSSHKNYGDCSANFEFSVVSEDSTGQRILFTAMNKAAVSYRWYISGFGDPIYSTKDAISHFFGFSPYYPRGHVYGVVLYTTGRSGCVDTLWQQVHSRRSTTSSGIGTRSASVRVYPNPFSELVSVDFPVRAQPASVAMYNSIGQLVYKTTGITTGRVTIERGSLASGLYYFAVDLGDGQMEVAKVSVQ